MAKALVEVIGDSASAVRALEETSAALDSTGKAAAGASVEMDTFAASLARAQATRAETLLSQSGALTQFAAANAGTTEGAAAAEASAKRQTQAYKLLGIQAAATGKSVTETAGTIGRGLTTYATVPAAFIGYEAVKQAIDFNQQMLLLKTQAGDATDSIKTLSSEVLKLASSGAPQGPVQLSEGLYHLVSLGLRGAQAMGTLREASLAAGMGMANLEDTSTALGAAVVSGIKGAQNYQQAMATLVGTAGAGNMRFQDLAASIGNVIPSAAAAGVSLHEMGAALAVLTDRGMSSEEAATRLRMSLALIQRPSKAAQAALADMGVNADQLGAIVRQPNGLLKVLEVLRTAMDSVGKVRGNRDLLEAFGGARSGIGIQTLVQSLDSSVSSYQGKLQQINQDQQQFAENQQQYLESPAYKLHTALAQVETDLVKLGTALTPAVTGLANTISGIASAFTSLPGPVKESIGVIVGILAIGGPLALAVSGIGKLIGGIGAMFSRLIPESTVAMTTIGTEADAASGQLTLLSAAETKVGTSALAAGAEARTGFLSMLGPIGVAAAAVYGLDKAIKGLTGVDMLHTDITTQATNDAIRKPGSKNPYPQGTSAYYEWQLGFRGKPSTNSQGKPVPEDAAYKAGVRAGRQQQRHTASDGSANAPGIRNAYTTAGSSTTFALPPNIQVELDRAKAGVGNVAREYAQVRTYIEHEIHAGNLSGTALADAYKLLATTQNSAVASVHKSQTQFDQVVHNDQDLAQARIDLANGEYFAAQRLLKQDQARLEVMLAEATTGEERTAVLRQLATVEHMRHEKADQYQLSPEMQMQIARANAIDALNPSSYGPDAEQVRLARQAKAAAEKAINSHILTLQGLTAAWQIVGQENAVLAQAKGAIDTYHAVSSKAIVDSVKGLNQVQQVQLRERIAQAEAHRGYAPNQGGGGQHHTQHVHVTVSSNDSHIVKVTKKHKRSSHQRAGGRR